MKVTFTISSNLKCSIFDMFLQDVDEVIMLINFYLRLGKENGTNPQNETPKRQSNGVIRKKVNDNTATGGWY